MRVSYNPSKPITREDCEHHEIVVDDPYEKFKFKAAAPRAFAHLRACFDVSDTEYKHSICGDNDLIELSTPGKSGALFFKTADGRFIIKTVSKVESKFLRSILFDYTEHIKGMARGRKLRTLLPHFFDLVHIDTAEGRNIRLVVMNNLRPGMIMHETYDLKGSSIGRWASEQEKANGGCVLKDLDFKHTLHVNLSDRELIREQLEADCDFLRRQVKVRPFRSGRLILRTTPQPRTHNLHPAYRALSTFRSFACFTSSTGGNSSPGSHSLPQAMHQKVTHRKATTRPTQPTG